jgi:hypothetical protein
MHTFQAKMLSSEFVLYIVLIEISILNYVAEEV